MHTPIGTQAKYGYVETSKNESWVAWSVGLVIVPVVMVTVGLVLLSIVSGQ